MKKQLFFLCICGLLTLSLSNTSCSHKEVEIETTTKIINGDSVKNVATINIEGMTCEIGCGGYISKKISQMKGVFSAEVLFEENKAKVKYDELLISEKEIIAEIQKLNEGQYKVTKVEIEKTIKKAVS